MKMTGMMKAGNDTNYTFNRDMLHLPLSTEQSPFSKKDKKGLSASRFNQMKFKQQNNNNDL